jgi:hypothetical protein
MAAKERHGLDGDIEKTCENCRYFSADSSNGERGDCRRHAPHPSNVRVRRMDADGTPLFESWWPAMNYDDWCGEFEEIDSSNW